MFDHPALEVALGLIFVYLVLSLVCTAANELISGALAWRSDFLKKGLNNLLDGDLNVKQLFDHPLLKALIRPARDDVAEESQAAARRPHAMNVPGRVRTRMRSERYPSYLPSRAVISALVDRGAQAANVVPDEIHSLEDAIDAIEIPAVRDTFRSLLAEAKAETEEVHEQVRAFRRKAETWYDDSMARVSGWYRRRIQLVLLLLASGLAAALNADSIRIGQVLWEDDAVRAAIVAQAEAASRADTARTAGDAATAVGALPIPLGWLGQDWPAGFAWLWFVPAKLLGLLLTALAVSLGAPFWFDLLGKVARLRSSGAPPPDRTKTEKGE